MAELTPEQEARVREIVREIVRELLALPTGHARASGFTGRPGASVEDQCLAAPLTDEGLVEGERAAHLIKPSVVVDDR